MYEREAYLNAWLRKHAANRWTHSDTDVSDELRHHLSGLRGDDGVRAGAGGGAGDGNDGRRRNKKKRRENKEHVKTQWGQKDRLSGSTKRPGNKKEETNNC